MKHESKCRNPHGHNYVAFIHAEAPELDELGRVIDFGVLKEKVGGWIDTWWDHGFIYARGDRAMQQALLTFDEFRPKQFCLNRNPTAENMAAHLLDDVCPEVLDGTGVTVTKVVLWETENCFVEVTLT